ncbi:unnamed protein product [Rhizophagus irregularis]|uniref:Lipoprotein n=1 Tax=Rhizophagus irregularis TaxID=588596 RepID=A0A915Z8A1_9GLOM|nr:unnamed protein product [Rhizophagus irregularis]
MKISTCVHIISFELCLAFFLTSNLLISCGQLQITNNAGSKLALSALQFPNLNKIFPTAKTVFRHINIKLIKR